MITIVQTGGDGKPFHYKEFMISDVADVANLPTADSSPPAAPGSTAYTQDLEHSYLLGADNVWREV